ncbi:hypothetical protein [Parasulfitobacter algicola]|uniref:Uncharacterized protein n=1 Tax=Parasulfitobacter algicola TaxID=2614809 RepID=A0ABX2IYY5_9RHOB|nr:hypothetical protein [Sulfitobacter algicola]NSX55884.1 hypothetical protein [Sulfitobacter algicola]
MKSVNALVSNVLLAVSTVLFVMILPVVFGFRPLEWDDTCREISRLGFGTQHRSWAELEDWAVTLVGSFVVIWILLRDQSKLLRRVIWGLFGLWKSLSLISVFLGSEICPGLLGDFASQVPFDGFVTNSGWIFVLPWLFLSILVLVLLMHTLATPSD